MKIGFGQGEITPKNGKIPIAGSLRVRYVDEVHDPIFATAMFLEDEGRRLYLVSCDICHPNRRLTEELLSFLNAAGKRIQAPELILCGTHATPYCYVTDDEPLDNGVDADVSLGLPLEALRKNIATGVLLAIEEAERTAETCLMTFSEGEIQTGFCRRIVYRDRTAVMYGDPHREDFLCPESPDGGSSQFLYFYRASDRSLKGIFAAVPSPAQADESSRHITADYWGVVRNRIAEHYGARVRVVGVCRAAGELTPHRMLQFNGGKAGKEWGPQIAERTGNLIADSILREESRPIASYEAEALHLSFRQIRLLCPIRLPSQEQAEAAATFFDNPENFDADGGVKNLNQGVLYSYIRKRMASGVTEYEAPITVAKLADVLLFTAPMELFCTYAKQIAMAFPENPVFDVQLANDCLGYLPTAEAIAHGGYSTDLSSALCGPDVGENYVQTVKKALREIQNA